MRPLPSFEPQHNYRPLECSNLGCFDLDRSSAVSPLLQRLTPIAKTADELGGIQLALELEPGPLFTVGGWDALLELCCRLDDSSTHPAVRRRVGVNLDIPHWAFLSHITLERLASRESGAVRRRIVHAHISDHDHGHFCDNEVPTFHSLDEFSEWIRFLAQLSGEPRVGDSLRFSGFVSCEMEACRDVGVVRRTCQHVAELCARYAGPFGCGLVAP